MSNKKTTPYLFFEDLAIEQRKVKAQMKMPTLEEARALAQWIKSGNSTRRQEGVKKIN